jgi:hypothetical protein
MRYLYGDSSESALEINYLAFLRDAIDFGVAVLQAEHGLVQARERKTHRDRSAEESARAVEHFGRVTLEVVETFTQGDAPVNRCAASVAAAISDAVKREIVKVRSGQGTDTDQIVGELQRLREKCVSALATLLATHDLPDAEKTTVVQWGGAAYEARMVQRVGWGLEVTVALDIAPSSPFGHDLRIDKVMDGVTVHAPETAGWLKKDVKMVPHKLGRFHLNHVTVSPSGTVMRVRATPEAGAAGFDIGVSKRGDVTVERAGRSENEVPFDTDERDLSALRALAAKLEAAIDGLHGARGGLVSAVLDGKTLATHEHPAVMVERLVASMAPVVNEIARHSLSPRELVLKRLLGGDRREEVFLSRAELEKKVQALPPQSQRVFVPLGIVEPITIESRDVEIEADDPPVRPMPAMGQPRPQRSTVPPPAAATSTASGAIDEEAPGAVVMGTTVSRAQTPSPVPSSSSSSSSSMLSSAMASMVSSGQEVEIEAEAPPFPQTPPSGPPAAAAAEASEEESSSPSITLEADLPPVRIRPGSLPPLPPLSTGGTSPPPSRSKNKTMPPPAPTPPAPPTPPPARVSVAAAEAAVDAALRDLDESEPTQVVSSPPRPGS